MGRPGGNPVFEASGARRFRQFQIWYMLVPTHPFLARGWSMLFLLQHSADAFTRIKEFGINEALDVEREKQVSHAVQVLTVCLHKMCLFKRYANKFHPQVGCPGKGEMIPFETNEARRPIILELLGIIGLFAFFLKFSNSTRKPC